jgi:solute carrier family 38 (sodium-coupled neutral amino acid transporter), member 11
MTEKSPFFRPSSNHRVVVMVRQHTPGGTRRIVQKEEDITETKSSMVGTASNLINAIVGCGIVGIPFAIRQSGFGAGVLLILFVALVTEKSLRLLVDTAKHVHVPSYEMLAEACFGVTGFRFVAINMFLSAYGGMISYLMLVKDSFGSLLLGSAEEWEEGRAIAEDSVMMRRTILLVISLAVMLPLACKRDMADLAFTSRLNVFIDITLVALVAYNAPIREAAEKAAEVEHPTSMLIHVDTIFIGLGVLSFAFVCQHSAFIIAGSLENPTSKRWGKVTSGALSLCCVLAMVCGVMGYLGYREGTEGNILESLDKDSITANIARGMLGTSMLFVYPLESFVARHVCVVLLFAGRVAHEGDDSHILARRDRRYYLTTALYILAVVPATLADDLGPVLALTGAVAGSSLSYIGPGAVYLGVHGERFLQLARESFGSSKKRVNTTEKGGDSSVEDGIVLVSGGTLKSPALAVETTPLVGGGTMSNNGSAGELEFGITADDGIVVVEGIWNHIVWYSLGMPIWCAIAKLGQDRLKQYINEMAMKSPHPIRIGDVEYKRVLVHMAGKDGLGSELQKMVRERSYPQLHNIAAGATVSGIVGGPATEPGFNINQKIGQGLLEKQKMDKAAKALEADPQKEPPTWLDFYIAICYILLGLMALFAGIYSIFF